LIFFIPVFHPDLNFFHHAHSRRVIVTLFLLSISTLPSAAAVGLGKLNSDSVAPKGPEGTLTEVAE
jgi:hypothetical protein